MSILGKYASRLPPVQPEFRCSMGEGNTPLLPSRVIGPELGLSQLYFKCEHQNPTGSYKDRYIALHLSLLRQAGATLTLGTSSGNTGSSLAAFSARYGLPCYLFVCERTPAGKLMQMRAHGAHVYRVKDFCITQEMTSATMHRLAELSSHFNTSATISAFRFSPEGMNGVKTLGYEIAEQIEAKHVFAPGGGCGLYVATARGLREASAATPPRAHIVQPTTNDTVVTSLRAGSDRARPVNTTTRISGLAVQEVYDGHDAIAEAHATGGTGFLIEDEDAWTWQRELLLKEGVWVEPAGAVALAGLAVAVKEGVVKRDEPAVCILTGHGFKDPASALPPDQEENPMITYNDIEKVLGL